MLAWVGGRDFLQSRFDRVKSARRQAGSAFKPFVYLTAFERSFETFDLRLDVPVFRFPGLLLLGQGDRIGHRRDVR